MSALESSSDITSTFSDRDPPSCTPLQDTSSQHTADTSSHSSLGASLRDDVTPTSPTSKTSELFQTSEEFVPVVSTKSKSKRGSVTSITNSSTQGQLILHGRPEGAPGRPQKEQKKRLKEYEKMVEASRKRDLQRSISELQHQEEREKEKTELQKFWFDQVIPQWSEKVIQSKRVQEAWWRGLPPRVREKVWKKCVVNEVSITEDLYGIFLGHAKKKLQIHDTIYSQKVEGDTDTEVPLQLLQTLKGREDTLDSIRYDVSRTFPTLAIFNDNGPYYEPLHNLLGAYTCFRPDIGYVQGMSYIAAVLILNLDEYDAFVCLANLLNKPLLQTFYRFDDKKMDVFFRGFDKLVSLILPTIADHLDKIGVKSNYYLLDWIFTLFSKPFDIEVACRIWDVYFRDGEQFIYRTALGILRMIGDELLTCKEFIDVAQLLSKMSPKYNNHEVLFENISKINISLKQVEQAIASADKEHEIPDS